MFGLCVVRHCVAEGTTGSSLVWTRTRPFKFFAIHILKNFVFGFYMTGLSVADDSFLSD
jgi:hypothetical protein